MFTLGSITFWLYFHLFFISLLISVLLPGLLVLKSIRFSNTTTKLLVGFVLGILMWSAQGYLLGYLHLRFLTYLYILITLFFTYKYRDTLAETFIESSKKLGKVSKKILLLMLIGTITQIIPVVGSGLRYIDGVRFFEVNGYDGLMHLGFIQSIVNSFPPEEPGALGNLITNYHYWSDLFFAELVRVWHLPIANLFFQYAPFIISILTAFALYKLLSMWTEDLRIHLAGLFFLYFSGDATYLFMLALHQTFGFHTPAIDNGAAQFLNMPHAMAKMIFLTGLVLMQYWIRTKEKIFGILTFVFLASLTGFKVYFAIFSLIGTGSLILYTFLSEWFKENRKELRYIKNALTVLRNMLPLFAFAALFFILFLIIFLPPNKNAGGLYYSPLEWPKVFLGASGIDFSAWWHLNSKYSTSGNTLALTGLNIIAILITFIAIYGTRVIGFFIGRKTYKQIGGENIAFLIPALVIFNVLGLTTLQKSGGLNVFNFFAVSTVILTIFSAFKLVSILKPKSRLRTGLVIIILLLTIPRTIYEVYFYTKGYITKDNAYTISNNELQALEYIKKHAPKDIIIQSHPVNHLDRTVPYVGYYANRRTYLTGVDLQKTHNQPIEERIKDLDFVFNAPNSLDFLKKLEERNIDLLYMQKKMADQYLLFEPDMNHYNVFFENDDVIVYDTVEGL